MENVLYLDDYINLYNEKKNYIFVIKPYNGTLANGIIQDRDKFIKLMKKVVEEKSLQKSLLEEKIYVIINSLYTKVDKYIIKEILEILNYKKIIFVHELDYIKVNKSTLYINSNFGYYYIYFINEIGNIEVLLYKNSSINIEILHYIVTSINKKNIYIYGKNYKEIENILKSMDYNYYYFEESSNLLINLMIAKKMSSE